MKLQLPSSDVQSIVHLPDESDDEIQVILDNFVADLSDPDCGMSTVEYAIGTIAAAAFAGILYKVITGGQIFSSLSELIMHALKSIG